MNKADLILALKEEAGLTKPEAGAAVNRREIPVIVAFRGMYVV